MDEETHTPVEWRAIGAASIDGVGVLDGDEYVYVNQAFAEVYGYDDPDDLVKTAWQDCYEVDEHERIEAEVLPQVREEGHWHGEAAGCRRDGSSVRVELSLRATEDELVVCVVRDVTERETREHEHELERYETIIETVEDGVYALDEDLRFDFVNDGFCEMLGRTREDLIGISVMDLFTYVDEAALANDIRERVVAGDTSTGAVEGTYEREHGETVSIEARYRLHPTPKDGFAGSVGTIRDVTDRVEREQALERQRDELDTLNRINDLLLEITRELLESPTREGLERTVCERLAASALYQFAWIGEREPDGSQIVTRASAGVDDGYVGAITITADETNTGLGPGNRALRTGDVQVSQNVHADPTFEPWREAALDRDFQSAAAVPLLHGGTTYGCLAVYTTRPLGFSQREQSAFEILGEAVGFAIHAIETWRLLFADSVLELEFEVADTDQFLVRHSERFECDLSVEGHVTTKSGGWLLYAGVEGASPAALCEAATDLDDLERVRVVCDVADDGLIEYRFHESSLLGTLAEAGVKLRSADATAGVCRFVVEAPQSADTHELVGRVRDVYPGVNLVAQRERDRSITEVAMPGGPLNALTDRQREALETAYRAGYFD